LTVVVVVVGFTVVVVVGAVVVVVGFTVVVVVGAVVVVVDVVVVVARVVAVPPSSIVVLASRSDRATPVDTFSIWPLPESIRNDTPYPRGTRNTATINAYSTIVAPRSARLRAAVGSVEAAVRVRRLGMASGWRTVRRLSWADAGFRAEQIFPGGPETAQRVLL
jgi:hypothetical protein